MAGTSILDPEIPIEFINASSSPPETLTTSHRGYEAKELIQIICTRRS